MKTKPLFLVLFLIVASISYGFQAATHIALAAVLVRQVHMSGTATWHFGSDEQSGTVDLAASFTGESRMELRLNKGSWVETQGALSEPERNCAWQGFDGVVHQSAFHNCVLGVTWFLPQVALQLGAGAADGVVSAANDQGTRLHHQRNFKDVDTEETGDFLARLSSSDLEIDPATGQPSVLFFNLHPDNDAGVNIPVEVHFSDYRQVEGATLPFHIEKFVNHTLVLDLRMTEAQVGFAR